MVLYVLIFNVDFCIVFFGSGGVGKIVLLRLFFGQMFNEEYLLMVDDYYVYRLNVDGSYIMICVVDIVGLYLFFVMRKFVLILSYGFIVVYVLDDIQFFKEVLIIMD